MPVPPIVLDEGQLSVSLAVETSLASKQVLDPLSIAPDVWWGVTPKLTVGLTHSDASRDRVDFAASICVRTDPTTCPHAYHGSGLDARYLAWTSSDGAFAVAPRARALLRDIDPNKPAITLGALASWHRGRWTLATDPYYQIGIANDDLGNRDELVLPLYATVEPTCRFALTVETGYITDLAVWQDGYHVPLALSVTAHATAELDLGVQAGFTSLAGPQNNVGAREAWFTVSYRFSSSRRS
jgi:hypothetical protein